MSIDVVLIRCALIGIPHLDAAAGGEGQQWGRLLGVQEGFCPFSPGSVNEKGLKSTNLVLGGRGERHKIILLKPHHTIPVRIPQSHKRETLSSGSWGRSPRQNWAALSEEAKRAGRILWKGLACQETLQILSDGVDLGSKRK